MKTDSAKPGRGRAEVPATRTCIHCGTPFSTGARGDSAFCCNGCEYVHRLLHKEGLEHYYDLRDSKTPPVSPAVFQPRDFTWLETRVAELEAVSPKTAEMVFDLEGISCVGCVWLIERLFREQPGAVRIEINTQYGQARLQWRSGIFPVVDFAREIQRFGYVLGPAGERPQEESRRLLARLGLCGAFALNAMLFTLPRYLGMEPDFALAPLFELLALLFATLSLLTGGSYFIKRGWMGLRQGVLHIDFPIGLGLAVAYGGSLLGWWLGLESFLYFDFVAIFIFLMLVGRWVQERALEKNRHQLLSRNRSPQKVQVVADDLSGDHSAPLETLTAGMRFRILPGEIVPVLAELDSLRGGFSLEWINGESTMREFHGGQYVPSGAQNIGLEPVLLKARQSYADSLLKRLLASAQGEGRDRRLEGILRVYLTVVLGVAFAGAAVWWGWAGQPLTAMQVFLSVLVVSCPCAIGVAAPLAEEWAVLRLRNAGVFVRTRGLFRNLARIGHIVFDKTGTLTLEAPALLNPETLRNLSPADRAVLRRMVQSSLHPVSRALREALLALPEEDEPPPSALRLHEEIGMGIEAVADNTSWRLGRPSWATSGDRPPSRKETVFTRDGSPLSSFAFREAVREDAAADLRELAQDRRLTILSGDRKEKVRALARELGIPDKAALGDQSPDEKARFVEKLSAEGTLYLGDGANDALAFDRASVRGTPATPHGLLQDRADFFFTGRSLDGILRLFHIRDRRRRALGAVFAFTIAYNFSVVAIALAGHMHPLLAAILMPLSSLASLGIVAGVYQRGQPLDFGIRRR